MTMYIPIILSSLFLYQGVWINSASVDKGFVYTRQQKNQVAIQMECDLYTLINHRRTFHPEISCASVCSSTPYCFYIYTTTHSCMVCVDSWYTPEQDNLVKTNLALTNESEVYEKIYDPIFKMYGPYGGTGGGAFSDRPLEWNGNITTVHYCVATEIESIRFTYGSVTSGWHGLDRAVCNVVPLLDEEYIASVHVCATVQTITLLQFNTNSRTLGPYGDNVGTCETVDGVGRYLKFISGRKGDIIDQLYFFFK